MKAITIDETRVSSRLEPGYYGPSYLEQLMTEVAQGDRDALTDLYDHTVQQVMAVCRAMSDSPETVKNIICDVYTHVWSHVGDYDPAKGSVMGWLCDMARRRAIALNPGGGSHSGLYEALDPQVIDAIDSLPPMRRRLIELAFFEGFSPAEIADQLHLPLDVIKLQLRRAQTLLQTEALRRRQSA